MRTGDFDLWNTGKLDGDQSFDVAYRGKRLASRARAYWRVTVWDNHGQSATSDPAAWEMGLLSPSDWTGQWLAAENEEMRADREQGLFWMTGDRPAGQAQTRQFRLDFVLESDAQVTMTTAARTDYTVFIDGRSIELPFRSPLAWGPRGAIETVADLAAGKHVLALSLKAPTARSRAELSCALMVRAKRADGTSVRFDSKATRTATQTPDGWTAVDFDDAAWRLVTVLKTQAALPGKGAFLLRREFAVNGRVASARLYVTALGAYEAYINGRRVGDDVLAPESTDFTKRALYRVHDVTALLKDGDNAIGAMVGDGFYGSYSAPAGRFAFGPPPLRYLSQLEIAYDDGRSETVATDADWSISAAPITFCEIYDGEDYDARLEQPGWAAAGFATSAAWAPAGIAPVPPCRLDGMISPPIRRTRTLKPRQAATIGADYIIDFGQNFAGWVRLKVRGERGDRIVLRFAEILKADGHIDQSNLRGARATDIYTLRGDPKGEVYEPRFTYHGFRYVEISGLNIADIMEDVLGIAINSDLEETGRLRIGNALIQMLWRNTLWSQRSNFMGIPTDCPQRDERLGWMGDANVFWGAAAFNMNVAPFTERFMVDVREAQNDSGAYSMISPNAFREAGPGDGATPGWADAGITLPWTAWKWFGDTAVIDQNWESMARYIDFVAAHSDGFIWSRGRGADLGDWLSLDAKFPGDATTPKDLIATAMWKRSVDAMADMAEATGRREAAAIYAALSANIKGAFTRAYVRSDGSVGNESQTGYILALTYDLLPDGLRAAAASKLHDNIVRRGDLLTTGFLGTPHSLDALAEGGYSRTLYDLMLRTAYPSWGHMVVQGATTMWERWNGDTGDVAMNSYNHYALGAVTGFVFRRIAGIDPTAAGFRTFSVNPVLDDRVKSGGGDFDSVLGRISTDWALSDAGAFRLNLTVPVNARARVFLPASTAVKVKEGGRPIGGRADIRLVGQEGDRLVVEAGSGDYRFIVD